MKNWFILVLLGVFTCTGCLSDDDTPMPQLIDFELPVWEENVEFVSKDTTPSVQIASFVAANGLETVETASGLVYLIQQPGGMEKPVLGSTVVAWYKGYTVDGVIFDESRQSPFSAQLTRLIQGWQEAIPLLGRGGKMWMFLTPELAYGDNPPASTITPTSVLVFEIELVDFQ